MLRGGDEAAPVFADGNALTLRAAVKACLVLSYASNGICPSQQLGVPIGKWDVSAVTDMSFMFQQYASASAFDQDISAWNVATVTNMRYMFRCAFAFNQDISANGQSTAIL